MSFLLFIYTAPADYDGGHFIVSFAPSLTIPGSSFVMVHTKLDSILEGLEYFTAVLSVPTGFINLQEGVLSVARVNITDTTSTSKCVCDSLRVSCIILLQSII